MLIFLRLWNSKKNHFTCLLREMCVCVTLYIHTEIKMQESIELFIKFTEIHESTLEGRIAAYEKMLRDIATGSWCFSEEFNAWRSSAEGVGCGTQDSTC